MLKTVENPFRCYCFCFGYFFSNPVYCFYGFVNGILTDTDTASATFVTTVLLEYSNLLILEDNIHNYFDYAWFVLHTFFL